MGQNNSKPPNTTKINVKSITQPHHDSTINIKQNDVDILEKAYSAAIKELDDIRKNIINANKIYTDSIEKHTIAKSQVIKIIPNEENFIKLNKAKEHEHVTSSNVNINLIKIQKLKLLEEINKTKIIDIKKKKDVAIFILNENEQLVYSKVTDSNILKYIKCNFYTSKEFLNTDNNLLPKYMCKIHRTVNLGNTEIINEDTKVQILKDLKYDSEKFGDNIDIYQYTISKSQLKKLEIEIEHLLSNLIKEAGNIPGPIYIAYSKILEFNGNYISRYCKNKLKESNTKDHTKKFYNYLLKELDKDTNKDILEKTLYTRHIWKGSVDLVILLPNMNNINKVHTNMFDYKMNNKIVSNIINNEYMNNIIKLDPSKPNISDKFLKEFNIKNTFIHDSDNICSLHGCSVNGDSEYLSSLLTTYSDNDNTLKSNAKDKKIILPKKCLRPFDYVKNGYNPKGNDIRDKFAFKDNVDYTDIIFNMIFGMAFECLHKNAHKDRGIANRWNNFYNKDPDTLNENELCDDSVLYHTDLYLKHCINKGGSKGDDDEENEDLPVKPIKIKKNHYTMWNEDIMVELTKRNQKFPGIQEYIYPFFELEINKTSIINNFYYMPWGDKLLENTAALCENEITKLIKSNNNIYSLFVNQYGQIGIKKNDNVINWLSKTIFDKDNYNIILSTTGIIQVVNDKNAILISIKSIINTFKNPLSLILHDNGKFEIYENGMVRIPKSSTLSVTNNSIKKDISYISKYGLFDYINNPTPNLRRADKKNIEKEEECIIITESFSSKKQSAVKRFHYLNTKFLSLE